MAVQNLTPTPEEITNSKGETIKYNITLDDKTFEWKATIVEYTDANGNAKTISTPDLFQKNNFASQSVLNYYGMETDQLKSVEEGLLSLALVQGMAIPGYIPPPWVNAFNSKTNKNPLTSPSSNSSNPQTPPQTNSTLGGFANLLNNLYPDLGTSIETIVNTTNALKELGQNGKYAPGSKFGADTVLVYPSALRGNLDSKMDTCVITQFNYQAPNSEEFIKGKNFQNVLQDGLLQGGVEGRYTESKGMVILPMPQSFQEERAVQFGEDTMNTMAAGLTQRVLEGAAGYLAAGAGAAAVAGGVNLATGGGQGTTFGLGGIGGAAKTGIAAYAALQVAQGVTGSTSGQQLLSSVLSSNILKAAGMNVSAETILARGAGIVPNPNMELLFRSPLLRNFGLAYRMTARSKAEGEEIRKIIRFFKQGMSPRNQSDGANYFLKTPNVFGVSFKTTNKEENRGMPKFKTCALRKFTTDYSPDNMWAAYDKGQPVSVTIVMEFGELTPIYSGDYNEYDLDVIGY